MPAKDAHHDGVRRALEKDGWHITHDPYYLSYGRHELYIDLGAEIVAAEKADIKIAVEIKGFAGRSEMTELERALGQFVLYESLLEETDPGRTLYLAVPKFVIEELFDESLGQLLIRTRGIRVIGFDPVKEEVIKWLPHQP